LQQLLPPSWLVVNCRTSHDKCVATAFSTKVFHAFPLFQSLQIVVNSSIVLIIAPLFVLTRPIFVYWLVIGNAIGLITIVMLSTELFTINSCRVAVIAPRISANPLKDFPWQIGNAKSVYKYLMRNL